MESNKYLPFTRSDKTLWINSANVNGVEVLEDCFPHLTLIHAGGKEFYVQESPEQVLAMLEGNPTTARILFGKTK